MIRGEIYRPRPLRASGREQQGPRYGVIVQATPLLAGSTVIVAPTSRTAPEASWRPVMELGDTQTRVLVDKISAVDVRRLGDLAGYLTRTGIEDVDTALRAVLAV